MAIYTTIYLKDCGNMYESQSLPNQSKLQPDKMDPFAQQVQRIENNDKVKEIVAALRLIPINDVNTRNQLNESLEKILTPAAHKIPETQKKITEFTFTEPEFSYHDIAQEHKLN